MINIFRQWSGWLTWSAGPWWSDAYPRFPCKPWPRWSSAAATKHKEALRPLHHPAPPNPHVVSTRSTPLQTPARKLFMQREHMSATCMHVHVLATASPSSADPRHLLLAVCFVTTRCSLCLPCRTWRRRRCWGGRWTPSPPARSRRGTVFPQTGRCRATSVSQSKGIQKERNQRVLEQIKEKYELYDYSKRI